MVHGKNRIPYWIDRRLTGLAEPDYDATISFGLSFEPEDSQYGKYRSNCGPSPCGPGGPRHPQRVRHVRVRAPGHGHPNTNAYSYVDGYPNADTYRDAGADRHRQGTPDAQGTGHGHPNATAYSYVDARPDG